MASLLQLDDGKLSLELGEDELPLVKHLIDRDWGQPQITRHATHDTLLIKGLEFIFQNDWDDPCLISSCAKGSEMLKALHSQISAP